MSGAQWFALVWGAVGVVTSVWAGFTMARAMDDVDE